MRVGVETPPLYSSARTLQKKRILLLLPMTTTTTMIMPRTMKTLDDLRRVVVSWICPQRMKMTRSQDHTYANDADPSKLYIPWHRRD